MNEERWPSWAEQQAWRGTLNNADAAKALTVIREGLAFSPALHPDDHQDFSGKFAAVFLRNVPSSGAKKLGFIKALDELRVPYTEGSVKVYNPLLNSRQRAGKPAVEASAVIINKDALREAVEAIGATGQVAIDGWSRAISAAIRNDTLEQSGYGLKGR